MAKRASLEKFKTPTGIAVYPHLTKPDFGNKEYPNPKGNFSVKVRLSAEDAAPLMKRIDDIANEKFKAVKAACLADDGKTKAKSKAKAKNLKEANKPYKMTVDEEGDETGEVEFNIKMNHIITKADGDTFKLYPKLFDAAMPKPNALGKDVQIWGGSEVKVAGEFAPFDSPVAGVGVSLRLGAVQVIKLVSGGNQSAEDYGFDGEEGGFVKENDTATNEDDDDTPEVEGDSDEF